MHVKVYHTNFIAVDGNAFNMSAHGLSLSISLHVSYLQMMTISTVKYRIVNVVVLRKQYMLSTAHRLVTKPVFTIIFRLVVQFLWLFNSSLRGPFQPNQQVKLLPLLNTLQQSPMDLRKACKGDSNGPQSPYT